MNIGTKSLLFGTHQVLLHPCLLFIAWWKLYGFPWDPRLWVAFVVHDWGYLGKPNMDGPEGDRHPELGAQIMWVLFDWGYVGTRKAVLWMDSGGITNNSSTATYWLGYWGRFSLFHSRFYAKQAGHDVSRLCVADKYVPVITPAWLYLPLTAASGELDEYMAHAKGGKYRTMNIATQDPLAWYRSIQGYLSDWVHRHLDGGPDHDTPATWGQP